MWYKFNYDMIWFQCKIWCQKENITNGKQSKSCCDIFLYKTLHFHVNLFLKFAFDTKLFKFLYDLDHWPQYQNYILCQYLRHVVYIHNFCMTLTFYLYVGSGGILSEFYSQFLSWLWVFYSKFQKLLCEHLNLKHVDH